MRHADVVDRLLWELEAEAEADDPHAVSLRLVTSVVDALPIDGAAVVWGTAPDSDAAAPDRERAGRTDAEELADAGALSVHTFPLHDGSTRIGMLDLYRSRADRLDQTELGTARVYADAASAVLVRGAGLAALASDEPIPPAAPVGTQVFQATGMVAVQLSTDLADAIIVLRERAFALDRSIEAVARDVIQRIVRFA